MGKLRIAELLDRRGWTQERLAEAVGREPATINRWIKGKREPNLEDMTKLGDALGVSMGDLFDAPNHVPIGPRLFVRGSVAAGVWKEALEWPEDDWRPFYGRSDVRSSLEMRFGLRVDGDSMNEIYPHGTILECVSFLGDTEIASGKRVVVLRRREDGELETTVKELRIEADGTHWLVPRSTNPAFQVPIRADIPEAGITETRVIATVVASYRLE